MKCPSASPVFLVNEFVVSKETVVLRRRERSKQKFGFFNSFDKTKFLYFWCLSNPDGE